MCGLYGFSNYSGDKIKNLSDLTNALAEESAIRGTDATGIAFCDDGRVNILKESKSAYRLNFKHSDGIKALIGHTRHSTQGSEKKNFNNHPFSGKCRNAHFALAHNGVLTNDKELRKKYKLPKSKIETDSYIAVQLIEQKKTLDSESIKYMAETVEGSFSFSMLDDKDNVWLVKGDSPLSIIHFPRLKLYVYASTEEILWKALIETGLFDELKGGKYDEIKTKEGDILKICPDGTIKKYEFEYSYFCGRDWWDYGFYHRHYNYDSFDYADDLKSVAVHLGYSPEDIDELLKHGFSLEEIEEYIYSEGEV